MPKSIFGAALLLAGTGTLLFAADPPSALPEGKTPAEKAAVSPLEGGYTIVSGEKDGKPIPEERIKGSIVRFTGDRIVGTDKDKKEFFAATYTLDTSKKPWAIKMKSVSPKEAEAVGLVKKDGNTVTIVYSLPDAAAPVEFRTQKHQHLFVMKALKPETPKGEEKLPKKSDK